MIKVVESAGGQSVGGVKLVSDLKPDLVRTSRAGDVFHYRWAARRCLKLIYPGTTLQKVIVEGSDDKKIKGEYTIDVAEYYGDSGFISGEIKYFQLKHTTVKKNDPFNFSDLKKTISGFAERFVEHQEARNHAPEMHFIIITNRPINNNLKKSVKYVAKNEKVNARFKKTLENYTDLTGRDLSLFCSLLEFEDSEGDYLQQKHELRKELSALTGLIEDDTLIGTIVSMIQEKALPDSDGKVVAEEIFKRFGVTSERDLFPAPPMLETLKNTIKREQHDELLNVIVNSCNPIIIEASGGVGKTIFASQMARSINEKDSIAIAYDCFGAGKYRNISAPRHRFKDALVQMINELTLKGLCDPFIPSQFLDDSSIMRTFLDKVKVAVNSIRAKNPGSFLSFFIDAADNAEMAAKEYNESCFSSALLREDIPEGVKIVFLCRPERKYLLDPPPEVKCFTLNSFTKEETYNYLKVYFPTASNTEAEEFYRLTNNGNPRVQSNALSVGYKKVSDLLLSLGIGENVESQIEKQLDANIGRMIHDFHFDKQKIESMCTGLAILPPFVPIKILSLISNVDVSAVISFVSDFGKSLVISENESFVYFRDEPTEFWFREKFSANTDQFKEFLDIITPYSDNTYVSEILPILMLKAEKYDDLSRLALSDKLLPENQLDKRNVILFRLQFAFKAALKAQKYADAAKVAFRLGEEVLGNRKQLNMIKENFDYCHLLMDSNKLYEIAVKRLITGGIEGADNIYSAAILSSSEDFKTDAKSFLRSAEKWLKIYLNQKKPQKKFNNTNELTVDDVYAFSVSYFNLFGIKKAINFIANWNHLGAVYSVSSSFFKYLIDIDDFDTISMINTLGINNPAIIIALANELIEVGRIPDKNMLAKGLNYIIKNKPKKTGRITRNIFLDDLTIISYLESCVRGSLEKGKILSIVNSFLCSKPSKYIFKDHYGKDRGVYFRAAALEFLFLEKNEDNFDELLPDEFSEKNKSHDGEYVQCRETIYTLMPWYLLRAHVLRSGKVPDISSLIDRVNNFSKDFDDKWYIEKNYLKKEIQGIILNTIEFYEVFSPDLIDKYLMVFSETQLQVGIKIDRLRSIYRLNNFNKIRATIAHDLHDIIESFSGIDLEDKSEYFVELSKAVISENTDDAIEYFSKAIESASGFNENIVYMWDAISATANQMSKDGCKNTYEIAHRYCRCAEFVGENVAREKYWNRSEAVEICAKLSPLYAISYLSRWRDRETIYFEKHIYSLIYYLIKSENISSKVGWAFSSFFADIKHFKFTRLCIEKAENNSIRKLIFDSAIKNLSFIESEKKDWKELKRIGDSFGLKNEYVEKALEYFSRSPNTIDKGEFISIDKGNDSNEIDWNNIFKDIEVSELTGLNIAFDRFKRIDQWYRYKDDFWDVVFSRISERNRLKMLFLLKELNWVEYYDIERILKIVPDEWFNSISVRNNWNIVVRGLSEKFASEFSESYRFKKRIVSVASKRNSVEEDVAIGIVNALLKGSYKETSSFLFGFTNIVSILIDPTEAREVLNYLLQRFEKHISDEFADGAWSEKLMPPEDVAESLTGLIWATLGDPESKMRWMAAHCVKRLADMDCADEIESLINWMEQEKADPFVYTKHPFYSLHAKLFLMIAFARASIENVDVFKEHREIFFKYAMNYDHVLIQYYCKKILLNIEKVNLDIFTEKEIHRIQRVGVSEYPVKEINFDEYSADIEETFGKYDETMKFHLHYDFQESWLKPLRDAFGVSADSMEKIVSKVIACELGVESNGKYLDDPRRKIFRENETYYHKSNYPKTDNYNFYLSYHAMFIVASYLLKKLPIVMRKDWNENEWESWFNRHTLTREDGFWTYDRRDPVPFNRNNTINDTIPEEAWVKEIDEFCLFNNLFDKDSETTWLNVDGFQKASKNGREESCLFSTALVPTKMAQSLLNTLFSFENHYMFRFPDYIDENPFYLSPWTRIRDYYSEIEKFDPLSGSAEYSKATLDPIIAETMGLEYNKECHAWFLLKARTSCLKHQIWKLMDEYNEDVVNEGNILTASLDFLIEMCRRLKRELVIEIRGTRRLSSKYYGRGKNEGKTDKSFDKIYILSADGRLRDSKTSYQLRKKTD